MKKCFEFIAGLLFFAGLFVCCLENPSTWTPQIIGILMLSISGVITYILAK